MSQLPQLYMRFTDFAGLPALTAQVGTLPDGISLCTHAPGDEGDWEALIAASFGQAYAFEKIMAGYPQYHPSRIFYLVRDGKKLATTAAFEQRNFPGEGWLHMVGVSPDAQGMGLSKYTVLAALYSFYARGYASVMLSTDDFRLPAIKTYLRLGFVPFQNHESHAERWAAVLEKLA